MASIAIPLSVFGTVILSVKVAEKVEKKILQKKQRKKEKRDLWRAIEKHEKELDSPENILTSRGSEALPQHSVFMGNASVRPQNELEQNDKMEEKRRAKRKELYEKREQESKYKREK